MNIYESHRLLSEYLLFHYGSVEDLRSGHGIPESHFGFPVRSVTDLLPESPIFWNRALDLGCAVGRSAFELSNCCGEVLGIDYSHSFVQAAERLRNGHQLPYRRHDEGHLYTELIATRPEHCQPDRISFEHGDATDLREDLSAFDLVHAANLLCRLPEPAKLLARLPHLVEPGGALLLTTPCTWLAEFTPPENWPAGRTLDWIESCLGHHFSLEFTTELPFVIREHSRKYQWSTAQATRWRRLPN
jgi:putative 4-mercaptohistidine N1-methyltranferase